MARKAFKFTVAGIGLCTALAAPAPALAQPQDRTSASEKGSFLAYAKVELRWENVAPYNLIQETFVHLTNDYPGAVDVKMYFVNGDAPVFDGDRDHPGWNWLDNAITLTANEPAYWAASTGQPKGVSPFTVLDPGPGGPGRIDPNNPDERYLRGFIVLWAINGVSGQEIRWNHLAGDATIVNYANEYAWQYNAYAFQVVNGVPHGAQSGTPGHLALDDSEYSSVFAELLLNFIASGADAYSTGGMVTHDTDLTLLPMYLDLQQETVGPRIVKASFDIWNENEVKFTNLDRCVECWDQELLSRHAIPNHFLIQALHTNAGKARIEGLQSVLCPESERTSLLGVAAKLIDFVANGAAAAGGNLHGLGFEPGEVWYDEQGPPPESNWEPPTTVDEIPGFLEKVLKSAK